MVAMQPVTQNATLDRWQTSPGRLRVAAAVDIIARIKETRIKGSQMRWRKEGEGPPRRLEVNSPTRLKTRNPQSPAGWGSLVSSQSQISPVWLLPPRQPISGSTQQQRNIVIAELALDFSPQSRENVDIYTRTVKFTPPPRSDNQLSFLPNTNNETF